MKPQNINEFFQIFFEVLNHVYYSSLHTCETLCVENNMKDSVTCVVTDDFFASDIKLSVVHIENILKILLSTKIIDDDEFGLLTEEANKIISEIASIDNYSSQSKTFRASSNTLESKIKMVNLSDHLSIVYFDSINNSIKYLF